MAKEDKKRGWKGWPAWVRGGVVGFLVGLLLLFYIYFSSTKDPKTYTYIGMLTIPTISISSVFGLIIGLLVGKIKSSKKKNG